MDEENWHDPRLSWLFQRNMLKKNTAAESAELDWLMGLPANERQAAHLMDEAWEGFEAGSPSFNEDERALLLQGIVDRMRAEDAERLRIKAVGVRRRLYRLAAAAAVLFLLLGTYFLLTGKKTGESIAVAKIVPYDVEAPKANKAVITLSNGQTVSLDSINSGNLAVQGSIQVLKDTNGNILYDRVGPAAPAMALAYNTLTNPRGSKVISMTLSDGSRVWLNAGSDITYPVAFTGTDRRVTIKGEAYFEVAHDAARPFYVGRGEVEVKVLGTHFNVNAYDDEADIRITLLEGSVKVSSGAGEKMIRPGQQAVVGPMAVPEVRAVDVLQAVAWKRGMFEFSNTALPGIMRQLSRWYDVEVQYKSRPSEEKFGGVIGNDLPLSAVLKLLEADGVHFELEGKILKVKS